MKLYRRVLRGPAAAPYSRMARAACWSDDAPSTSRPIRRPRIHEAVRRRSQGRRSRALHRPSSVMQQARPPRELRDRRTHSPVSVLSAPSGGRSRLLGLHCATGRVFGPSPPIDLPTVAQRDHDDQEHVVGNGVDHPVVPDSNPELRPVPERSACRRSGIARQKGDRPLDTGVHLGIQFAKRSRRCRADFDAIAAHAQPRSAFTCSQKMLGPSSAMEASNASMPSASSSASVSSS